VGVVESDLGAARSAAGSQNPEAAQEDEVVQGHRILPWGVELTRSGGLYAEHNGLEAAQGRGHAGPEGVQALRALKGQRFETEGTFLQAVEKQLGAEALGQYRALLLKRSEGVGQFNAVTYEAFLRQVLERITVPIILIEDGASYHSSQAVEQFRQAHTERLTVHRLT
jgi:hypothetical protein